MNLPAKGQSILVVDDEHAVADTLAAILTRAGYRCTAAYDAMEALREMARMRPELIISDVMMPGMNGVEFALQACKLQPGVKVLLVSGHAGTQEILEEADRECRAELLPKPVRPEEMLAKVAEVLGREAATGAASAKAARARCTVLLVDDETEGLELRKLVLESAGFHALTATNPSDALELFTRQRIGVVVTDHLLGRTTAAELVAAMRRLRPDIPVVSFSGTVDTNEALAYANHFIGKSEGPETLIVALDEILARRSLEDRLVSVTPIAEPLDAIGGLPSQRLLAAIVADSSDAILSKTLDGIITSWNDAAELMYGYSREEVLGKPVTILLPPDRPHEIDHILARLKKGERIFHYETVRMTKNRRRLDVSLTISPIYDGHGQLLGASTIARDITMQRGAEEALRKAEKLAMAGRMAATVAHEINNPLESIGNILYLLRNTVELNDEARRYVDAAHDELKRVSEISRLTLGMQRGFSNRKEPVRVTALLDNVLTLYQRKSITLGIEIRRDYRFDEPVVGSPVELRQVFSNLIVNAMDALATCGNRLTLRVHPARHWQSGEPGVRVSVIDNGPGIGTEQKARLFQAFYTTKGEQGTGIGLWVSHTIVENHGGTLRMRSSVRPGHSGSCFSVFLLLQHPVHMEEAA